MLIPQAIVQSGGATITSVDYTLGANVTMTNADQFYDGPSGSFAAGTWLVLYRLLIRTALSETEASTAKLWDGSTVYDENENEMPAFGSNSFYVHPGFAIVTLGSITTLKVSCINARPNNVIARDILYNSSTTHAATRLTGIKIA